MERTKNEKIKIRNWVENTNDFCFENIDKDLESYFCVPKTEKEAGIYEYRFQNILEFENLLRKRKKIVHNADIDRVCAVAAFKERRRSSDFGEDKTKINEEEKLPEFIYNM